MFNYELNGCGTTYINIGDGGAMADKHVSQQTVCCACHAIRFCEMTECSLTSLERMCYSCMGLSRAAINMYM